MGMNVIPIDDKTSLQQIQKLEQWRRSLGHRRRRLEQLEQRVKRMFLDLAEEERECNEQSRASPSPMQR